MARPPKVQSPKTPITKKQVKELRQRKAIDRQEGAIDQSLGRDTRMSRDGGTNRRLRS